MTLYYLVFGILYLIALLGIKIRNPKKLLMLMCIIMTLFQGLRWNTGPDWSQFYRTFMLINWDNVFSFSRGDYRTLEYGYALLNVIVKTIFGYYTAFLIILCGFINFTYYHFIEKCVPKYKTICYFMTLVCSELFPVRNTVAGVLVIWGIQFIISHNIKKYSILVVCSTLFHSSGILGIIFYWFDKYISKNILLAIFVCSSILVNYLSNVLSFLATLPILKNISLFQIMAIYNDAYSNYAENVNKFSIFSFLMNGIILFVILYYRDHQKEINSKMANVLTNMAALVIIVGQMARSVNAIGEISRISYFASIGMPIMFVLSFAFIGKKIGFQSLFLSITVLLYGFNRIYGLNDDFYSDLFIPYYSVFENSPIRDIFTAF